jgi:hypothetical protein
MAKSGVMVLPFAASLFLSIPAHAFVVNQPSAKAGTSPSTHSCGGHYSSERCPEKNTIKPDLESANRQRDQLKRGTDKSHELIGEK